MIDLDAMYLLHQTVPVDDREPEPRPAPGRRTLTMGLPPRAGGDPTIQRRLASYDDPDATRFGDDDLTRRMIAAAFRPDLHAMPVQRRATGPAAGDDVEAAAARGIAGPSGTMPFLAEIQQAFGRHEVGTIRAHTDRSAAEGSRAMGAEAFATGDHVAFAGAPSLHTAAHEAAHVIQQRHGVHLKGGVGEEGDVHERHADAVADLVVAGRSAETLLDQYAGGSPSASAGPVQRRLSVGGKPVDPGAVDAALQTALLAGEIDKAELLQAKRLQAEAGDKADFNYTTWKTAVQGIVIHDAASLGSLALHRGTITFTNVSKRYQDRAQQLLDLLAVHPSISAYINGRPCFITLVNSPGNPASVIDLKQQINIELASWYFETYELGYTLGMLMHEFAIHPMADADPSVALGEDPLKGADLPTGVKGHRVNTDHAGQVDHIFGAILGTPRNNIYRTAVIEMAELLAAESGKKGSPIAAREVTNLLDCFMMDCASILATNDHRGKGPTVPGVIAAVYNDYLGAMQKIVTDKAVLALMPGSKTGWGVAGDYLRVTGRLIKGQATGGSRGASYQPTDAQTTYLEAQGVRLHWIEPDGRCVFGSLAHVAGLTTEAAILQTLERLGTSVGLADMITDAGLTVDQVTRCIRGGRWADPHVGDIILEVAAVALGVGVTVVMPAGDAVAINGGGALIVRVTAPLEHYHATS